MKPGVVLIFLSLAVSAASSQTIKSLSLDFARTVQQNGRSEATGGRIYYDGQKITLEVREPLQQWMILQGNEILLYYPVEKRAIRLKSENPAALPFFHAFIGVVKENYGLAELGYTLQKSFIKADTLFAVWAPPRELQKSVSQVVVAVQKDKIIFSETRDAQGKIVARADYQNHFRHRAQYFPLHITIAQNSEQTAIREDVVYSNPVFDQPLPPLVVNFKIPDHIKIEEIEW